jgi:YVTN family beta-propeller protein
MNPKRWLRLGFLILLLGSLLAGLGRPFRADSTATTIPVGNGPWGIGVNVKTNRIYVANQDGDTVSVINGATNTVIHTIPVGNGPACVGVNPDTNRIYVANFISDNVSVIDGATDTVIQTIPVGDDPNGVGVNPATNRIYVANYLDDTVSVVNGATNTVLTTVNVGDRPYFVKANPATNRIYVSNYGSNNVSVINGATNTVLTTIPVGSTPHGIGVNPATNRIYVANSSSDNISVINGNTNTVIGTAIAGNGPYDIDVMPGLNRYYVVNDDGNTLSIMDGSTDTQLSAPAVGSEPNGVAVNTATYTVYVANYGGDTVSVISDAPTMDHWVYLPLLPRNAYPCVVDDFSDPASGWYEGAGTGWSIGYLNGEYRILLTANDHNAWGTPDLRLPPDFRLEVDARLVTNNLGSYGLIFGGQSGTYQFIVFPTLQEFLIERVDAGDNWTTLVEQTYNPLINPGTATNRLRIDRIGSSIHAYVNGVLVATYDDASVMGAGLDAGLRAYSYDEGTVDARFDNFVACPTTLPDPLYVDDFSVADRWATGDEGWSQWSYQAGEYEILVRDANTWSAVTPYLDGGLPRFAIEADMRFATGTLGGYGLDFGQIDWDHFYSFVIYPGSQDYGLWKETPSGWTTLVDFTYSPAINAGTATNHLRVERDGAEIRLYANDVLLASLSDSSYLGNLLVGLYVESGDSVPVAARYDNFVFRQLPPSGLAVQAQPGPLDTVVPGLPHWSSGKAP